MRHFALSIVISALLLSPSAWPQASNSTVRGTVRDQAQAVIPAAKVTLTNTATNVPRDTLTNDAGLYVFPGVIPGPYRLVAEFAGMQKFEGTLIVQVQQDATVDVTLHVAQAATTVEVLDVTPIVKTDSPSLGHVLERQRIEQLPINGRSYQALLATVPGLDNTGLIQFYGMRTNSSATLFDGAQTNEVWEGWDFGRTPGLDSIQEFHVEVNNSSAKFMRPVTVLLSSKSGTNDFHGAIFETNRNSGYGVARARQDYYAKPPFLNRNEYGTSAGGPVHLPRLYDGRNRTFWFFAWEASRQISATTERYNVPTEAMRNGDFGGLVDSQGRPFNLFDPLTTDAATARRQPLSYRGVTNMIDPARLSPTAKYLFSITPPPTLPQVNPLIDTNWVGPVARPTDSDIYSLRIDHRFSDRDHFFARYSLGDNTQEYPYPAQPMLNRVTNLTNRWRPNHTLATTWVRTLSPTMTNELLVSGASDFHRRGAGDYRTNYARDVLRLPNPFGAPNWPGVTGLGLGSYTFEGEAPFYLVTNYATFQDNATKIAGKHELQFGFHGRFELVDINADPVSGGFNTDTLATALIDSASTPTNPIPAALTGHPLANLYLGVLDYSAQFRRSGYHFRRQEYAPYFQDNWKVTPRLTLNLGLRYEIRPPLHDRDGTLLTFDFNKRSYVTGTDLDTFIRRGVTLPQIVSALRGYGGNIISYQEAGLPEHLVYMNWRHLGPRLGFAYRALDGPRSFVLRGGYRISYYTQKLQDWVDNQSDSPPVAASFQNSVTNTALSPDGLPNYGLRSVPRYIAGVNTPDSIIDINDTRTLTRGFNARFQDPHYRDGRVQDWNFTIEKEVMASSVVRLSYVGNRTTNIHQWVDFNDQTPPYIWYATRREPLPTGEFANVARRTYDRQVYGSINLYSPTGWANHNSFTAEFERRYSKGLGFQIYYVTGNTLLTTRDIDGTISADSVPDVNSFLPGAVPTDLKARNRLLNYKRDPITAKHRIRWNFIADLPFGRGKRFGGNASGPLQKAIGGWQIAGLGHWRTNFFTLPTNTYPTGQKIEIYGHQYPIEDCRSGICYPGYLYWNGYIPANRINSRDANGRPNGIMGVPANYKPAAAPLIPWGSTALPANAPAGTNLQSFWDTNTVWIPLNNGTVQRTTFNDNLHPWRNQYMPGIRQWFQDASVFKFVGITERVSLRFNVDFFNVFNHPNDPTGIAGDGIHATRNSGTGARVTQLGLRLMW